MRKIYVILLFLLAALSINAQQTLKITTANLNLRKSPNTKCEIITVIPKGTTVKIDKDCDCKWILIDYQGKIGYVNSSYLKIPKKQVVKAATQKPVKYYTNSEGIRVQSPTYYSQPPVGATARCRDGTYSFSRNRRGTCSHHGGVAQWLR